MSAGLLVGIGLLGGLGAVARLLVSVAIARRLAGEFPWGTLAVNLSGALALGVLAGAAVEGDAMRLAATGALGAFTTFSTWALETHRLAERGRPGLGAANVAVSLGLGLALVWTGQRLGAGL